MSKREYGEDNNDTIVISNNSIIIMPWNVGSHWIVGFI